MAWIELPELRQRLEIQWIDHTGALAQARPEQVEQAPCLVFLHEGLGSISQWRGFPQALCQALGLCGLVYARQGYGRSSLRSTPARVDYMHREAREALPALLQALRVCQPVLVGHSDGASIALLYAGLQARGELVQAPAARALIVMAPHLYAEAQGLASIAQARELFDGDAAFRERLGRHHDDVRHTFSNWADVWLSEAFRHWNLEAEVAAIDVPVLAIQGEQDQYGSLVQIRRIPELLGSKARADLFEVPQCRHSPHLEQPQAVLQRCSAFLHEVLGPPAVP